MPPGHCDRRCASLKALRDNLKLLLRRPGAAALAARDHLDPLAVATSTINRRSILWVVVLFRHHLRPPLCGRDGMLQHQPDRVSPPGRLPKDEPSCPSIAGWAASAALGFAAQAAAPIRALGPS